MKYDLQTLGPLGFQDAAAALAIAQFGPIVRRLGRGRDGGRDMEANGTLVWSGAPERPGEAWDGYTVFQVKHRDRPQGGLADARWFWGQIKSELDEWSDPDSKRHRVPRHLVFMTNVRLTPDPTSGGLAFVNDKITTYFADVEDTSLDQEPGGAQRRARRQRLNQVKKWRLIDGNDIEAWLDVHEPVRRAYGGFLTTGDVLADLLAIQSDLPIDQLGPVLQVHARNALIRERKVYFDEAGGDGAGVPLDTIAVDLPVEIVSSGNRARAMAYVLDRGEHVLDPRIATLTKPRHVVLTGAPGNGKTTITRFLVQAYRAALATGSENLGDDHREVLAGTAEKMRLLGRGLPHHRRWAVRVDLAHFAKRYVDAGRKSLIAWIAEEVTAQGYSKRVEPWALKAWMGAWPWFVALDGLDEVSEPAVRKWVIECIHEFVADAEADGADLMVLATTRPTGYVDELSPAQFDRLDLADLAPAEALAYGDLVTGLRLRGDQARRARVNGVLAEASGDDALRHLLRTPLQVQIMSIIAEGAGRFDPDRFSLFWRYYDVVARREQTKEHTRFAELLRDHAPQVLDLHERVGLDLQQRSESADGGTASMSAEDLRDTAWAVLRDEGFKPSGKDEPLLDRMVTAATQRLVLLVPRGGGYGFDVRSLQELMAARRLTTGRPEDVANRLRTLAPSPHWRNTWLFAAGRLFAEPQAHQHDELISLVQHLDEVSDRFSSIAPVGPDIAWDMLDDGMAASRPRRVLQLTEIAMSVLRFPAPQPVGRVAPLLVRLCEADGEIVTLAQQRLREALGGDSGSRANAEWMQTAIKSFCARNVVDPDVRMLADVKRVPGRSVPVEGAPDWEQFDEAVALAVPDDQQVVGEAAAALRAARRRAPTAAEIEAIERAAELPSASEVLEVAVSLVARAERSVVAVCREVATTTASRRRLAHLVDVD